MSVNLEIHDGMPHWYLSTDIWTVPNDPFGSPGLPVEGQPCYLYARVTNNVTDTALNATVKFYWANPSVGFDRNTATPIGQSSVTLNPGQVEDVLCLVPWIPTFVNGGHECVLAEAFHPSDPLPPAPDFNVPTDRHVAQRNLSVISAADGMFMLVFEVHNKHRKEDTFQLVFEQGETAELKPLVPYIGKDIITDIQGGKIAQASFYDVVCSGGQLPDGTKKIDKLTLPPFGKKTISLIGKVEGDGVLINVFQKNTQGFIAGGLSVLVLNKK